MGPGAHSGARMRWGHDCTAAPRYAASVTNRREQLHRLTERWRTRHDLGRGGRPRPAASPERERQAATAFPFHEMSPTAYADAYGNAMAGFTYDDERYADADLDAWLTELGRLLRERGTIRGG